MSHSDERTVLEKCLTEAKRRLTVVREHGDQLQESLIEADINHMLERLGSLYRGRTQ